MASLEERIENGLNEARTLILGAQVLLGFDFQAAFRPVFDELSLASRALILASMALMVCATALLISPAPYHRIVEEGADSGDFHRFISIATEIALLPFALGLGIAMAVAFERGFGRATALTAGTTAVLFALLFWWGIEAFWRIRKGKSVMPRRGGGGEGRRTMPDLGERIQNVLLETRVALPGAQALLGFQFIATLSEASESSLRRGAPSTSRASARSAWRPSS